MRSIPSSPHSVLWLDIPVLHQQDKGSGAGRGLQRDEGQVWRQPEKAVQITSKYPVPVVVSNCGIQPGCSHWRAARGGACV
jgi:hypothetical protein